MTNGFHPLWEYTLVALAHTHLLNFADGPTPLLRVYCLDLLLLALGAATFCAAASRSVSRQFLALLIAAPGLLWCITGLIDSRMGATWSYLNGMESALALLCFAVAFLLVQQTPTPTIVLLGSVFLGLATLARLDDIFIACGVAAVLLTRVPAPSRRRTILLLAPFPAIVAAYLIDNKLLLGIFLPISGGTKAGFALIQNFKWTLSLFLPVFTGDGPAALLPGTAQYYGFGERSGRLLQMILPALVCAIELARQRHTFRKDRPVTLLHGMCAGVIVKAAYNFFFVQAWYQGFWYYTVSIFIANLILVVWLNRAVDRLFPLAPFVAVPWKALFLHALGVLFAFNLFNSRRDADGPVQEQRLLVDSSPLRNKLNELGATRILEFDDGFTSYIANLPAAAGLGLALDPESVAALYRGEFLPLIYHRGYRILVAHGAYATAVDNQIAALNSNQKPKLWEIHGSEFVHFTIRPLGSDGSLDGMRFYQLLPLTP